MQSIKWVITCVFCLTFCLTLCVQSVKAQDHPYGIDLSVAIQEMRFARNHSGYNFDQTEKCLFPYIAAISDNWRSIPPMLRRELKAIFQRPDNPESWWYASDMPLTLKTPHFKFHYTKTGPDAVYSQDVSPLNGIPDFVDVCAESFEKSYRVEVSELGFKTPYDDFWLEDNGGDERYDVYLFSGPWLGFTMPEFAVAVQSTAIVSSLYFGINSRMYEFLGASEGKRYLETTCAHEFLHSIQFAYNYYMYRWFMEGSCTWAERLVYDGSDQGETDGNNYYNSQLVYWFRYPDWSLTKFDGWHEYGDVIWVIFLTERYDLAIVKDFYEDLAEGTYRDLANFYDAFDSRGTTLAVAFKEFTVWNYFTNNRYDDKFYSHGYKYPSVAIHLDNIHKEYPVRMDLDSEQSPENLGARYIRFLPVPGQDEITIKVDGSDVTEPDDLEPLRVFGTRGWGARLVIHRKDKSPRLDEIFLFPASQEGQKDFKGFGTDIEEIVLILSNLHPDLDIGSISYAAGRKPSGSLSEPRLSYSNKGEIQVSWELLDITDIAEVAIVRKRFAPSEGDQEDSDILPNEVYSASDADNDGLSDGNISIVGKVEATDTIFLDNQIFSDVNIDMIDFDPKSVRYHYAVVPLNEYGIMGTPAIARGGITPAVPPPAVTITTQNMANGEWKVALSASQPLTEPPKLISIVPDGRRIPVDLSSASDNGTIWEGKLSVGAFPPTGTYRFMVSVIGSAGNVGTFIAQGQQFVYENAELKLVCYPNPFRPGIHPYVMFNPPGSIKIFNLAGKLVREISESKWDGTNEDQQPVASGIYICLAEGNKVGEKGKIVKLMVIR